VTADEIDRFVKLAEGFEARHREYADAAKQNAHDQDFARAQITIGASYRKCAEQLRDVIGDLGSPTAEDYDRAADEIAKPAVRYALVEQMGHRATYAAIREATFLGEPMLEVTALNDGSVHLVSPKSIFEVTLMPEDQARNLAARTTSWTAVAIPAAHHDSWDDRDDVDRRANGESDDDAGDTDRAAADPEPELW
jgi:hypothetical protein